MGEIHGGMCRISSVPRWVGCGVGRREGEGWLRGEGRAAEGRCVGWVTLDVEVGGSPGHWRGTYSVRGQAGARRPCSGGCCYRCVLLLRLLRWLLGQRTRTHGLLLSLGLGRTLLTCLCRGRLIRWSRWISIRGVTLSSLMGLVGGCRLISFSKGRVP